MAEYRETSRTIQERHWTQFAKACMEVAIDGAGSARRCWRFVEQDAKQTDGGPITVEPRGEYTADFVAETSFQMLNPDTGATTGRTMTQREAFAVLYSLYIATATARDA